MAHVDAVVVDEAEVVDGDRHLQILITIRHLTRTQKRYLLSMGLLDICMGACMQKWHVGSLDGDILQQLPRQIQIAITLSIISPV